MEWGGKRLFQSWMQASPTLWPEASWGGVVHIRCGRGSLPGSKDIMAGTLRDEQEFPRGQIIVGRREQYLVMGRGEYLEGCG